MSQAVITKAFSEWKAQQAVNNQPVTLDEFIFAYIPDLDVTKPIDNTEGIPAADKIVHRQAVSKSGVVNANSVVYSVTLGAAVGDFNFNWIGLINKATSTLAMIIHAPTQSKVKNDSGQQGNVLVRSMLMEYSGAVSATQITTPAETWQIDFPARLAAMDERQRLENIDLYGAAAFFDSGYLVSKTGSQFFVTQGAGYVAGLRSVLAANQNITVSTKPVKVWLDVAWSGTLTSEWKVQSKITVAASLADYAENGVQHHVFALASIDASGNITDLRPKGTLNEQIASDALAKHEQSRNHPDATTSAKGFTQLSSATDSESESLAATSKAVKAANDNANTRFPIAGGWLTGNTGIKTTLGSITFGVGNTDVYIQNGTSNKYLQLGNDGDLKYSGSYIYHEGHKPTANDVDAVSAANGGTFKKEVAFNGGLNVRSGTTGIYPGSDAAGFTSANMIFKSWYGIGFYCTLTDSAGAEAGMTGYINTRNGLLQMKGQIIPGDYSNFDGRFVKLAGSVNITGTLRNSAEYQSTSLNSYRHVSGQYGTFWRNDGASLYLMLTNAGDQYGNYNSLRPFAINLATGYPSMSRLSLSDYTNFDARYYTKTLAAATFQPKGSYGAPDTSGISGNVLWWKNTATGVITMMGQTASVGNSGRVTFPFAFPTKCYGVIPTRNNATGNAAAMQPYDVNTTGWNLRIAGGGTETVMWIAMGK